MYTEETPSTKTKTMTKLFNDYEIKSELQKIERWKLIVKAGDVFPPKKLEFSEIKERAFDDLTGASYRSDEEWVLCGDLLVPPDLCDQKDQDSSGEGGGGNGGSSSQTPNDFDGTSGDVPTIPLNPEAGDGDKQLSEGFDNSNPGGGSDPTDPTNKGCGGDYDFWRPNPEEYKDYGSMSSSNLNGFSECNEMNYLLNNMAVDTAGM